MWLLSQRCHRRWCRSRTWDRYIFCAFHRLWCGWTIARVIVRWIRESILHQRSCRGLGIGVTALTWRMARVGCCRLRLATVSVSLLCSQESRYLEVPLVLDWCTVEVLREVMLREVTSVGPGSSLSSSSSSSWFMVNVDLLASRQNIKHCC